MKKLIFAVMAMSLTSLCFSASIRSLNKYDVKDALQDKTLITLSLSTLKPQLADNTVLLHFEKDGRLTGQFTKKPATAPQSDMGTWTVKSGGQVCVSWTQWEHTAPTCVYVYKLEKSLLLINVDNRIESLALYTNNNTTTPNQAF